MSQRSVTTPQFMPSAVASISVLSTSPTAHSRSSSMGDIRVSAMAAAIEGVSFLVVLSIPSLLPIPLCSLFSFTNL